MTFDLTHRVAAITGAGGGIGRAMARRFGRAGMKLVLSDVDAAALGDTVEELTAGGTKLAAMRVDVADPAAVQAFADLAYDRFGAVDILCNNAGVLPPDYARPVWEYGLEDWNWANGVNVMGVVHGIRSFVPRMIAQGTRAHVVNTASLAGLLGGSSAPLYSTGKHAVVYLSEALYHDLAARGLPIGVTLLCPGRVRTEIFRSERNRPGGARPVLSSSPTVELSDDAQTPEEVADMVLAAVTQNRLFLLTTAGFDGEIRRRIEDILARANPLVPARRESEGR